ncbi:hypothetical protein H4R35_006075 [Dimargaris xerosporica]|nr:hypothetical protein H4R35_006075 [Dimargaris xerosporica]
MVFLFIAPHAYAKVIPWSLSDAKNLLKMMVQKARAKKEDIIEFPKDAAQFRKRISSELEKELRVKSNYAFDAYFVKDGDRWDMFQDPSTKQTTLYDYFVSSFPFTGAYFAVDTTHKRIIVAYRGAEKIQSYLHNAQAQRVPYQPCSSSSVLDPELDGPKVHQGFQKSYREGCQRTLAIIDELWQLFPTYKLWILGQSLGGVHATFTALDVVQNCKFQCEALQSQLDLTTFGRPRMGTQAFAMLVAQTVPNNYRVTNANDLFSMLGFRSWGYWHENSEYWMHDGITEKCARPDLIESNDCNAAMPVSLKSVYVHNVIYGRSIWASPISLKSKPPSTRAPRPLCKEEKGSVECQELYAASTLASSAP